jgi:hypothetical protein
MLPQVTAERTELEYNRLDTRQDALNMRPLMVQLLPLMIAPQGITLGSTELQRRADEDALRDTTRPRGRGSFRPGRSLLCRQDVAHAPCD